MSVHKKVIKIESQCLRQTVTIGVVVPDKIDKVMILLHGYGGSFAELDENLPLLEYAEDSRVLIATPNMDNGYYIDHDFYWVSDFIIKELLDTLFTTYNPQIATGLYIAGISMGGFGSLLIGSKYPNVFKKIISISGAFIAKDVAIGNPEVVGAPGNKETFEYFNKTFAPFDMLEDSIERNAVAAIVWCSENYNLPEIILTCGSKDPLYERNLTAIRKFDSKGIEYDWCPLDGGVHDYSCFDEGLKYVFKMIRG